MISIKEIAKLADVSTATVSRVLNNKGGYAQETADRVNAIIQEFGYISNMAAKSLRQSKSNMIAIIVPDISNDFFATIALNLERSFHDHGYSTIICNSDNDIETEKKYHREFVSKMVDGIVSISGLESLSENLIQHNIPMVCIDRVVKTKRAIPIVRNDDRLASAQAVNHLIEQGCRKILFVSSYSSSSHLTNRREGYMDALKQHEIKVDYNLMLYVDSRGNSQYVAEEMVTQALQSGLDFDGIFAASDRVAAGSLYALKRAHVLVPNDVKIIGFDNSLYSQLPSPSLSTVSRNTRMLAQEAANTIIEMIHHPEKHIIQEIIVPHNLVYRESTKHNLED